MESQVGLIDTKDVEKEWGIVFEKGTHNELLKFPERRDEYSQVWKDQSGTQRYTDDVFFSSRTLNLSLVMVADGEGDFTNKLHDFREYMMQSGYFNLDCARLGLRFKLLYKNMQSYTKLTHLRKTGKVAARFKLTLQDDFPAVSKSIPGTEYGGYGVEWNVNHADPLLTRVAEDMDLHKVDGGLPVHSAIKACVLKDDGTVNYYLDAEDKTLKEDGATASNLDGSDGQVMIEIPEHYMSFETDGDTRRVITSLDPIPGAQRVPKRYVGAYEANVDGDKLASVSGVLPDTHISMGGFRNRARNRGSGWEQYTYEVHKDIFWLYMIEYGNRNIQAAYNSNLDGNGYRQGAFGDGVTDVSSSDWNDYNGREPMIETGSCDSVGAECGVKDFTIEKFKDDKDQVFGVPCFRGIENIYGHVQKQLDGLLIEVYADDRKGNIAYVFENSKDFNDNSVKGARKVGLVSRNNGYVVELMFGRNGDFLSKVNNGGSSTTYWSDYWYQGRKPDSGKFLLAGRSGGHAYHGANAGVGYVYANGAPSHSSAVFGSRLCFLPEGR